MSHAPVPLAPLRTLAQAGLQLEFAVLAPYLCALWSLHEDANPEARALLRSVAMEEMLHMALAANLVLALGGEPRLDGPRLPVRPFSREALTDFCALEAPAGAPEARGPHRTEDLYVPLRAALIAACLPRGEGAVFVGDPARQLPGSLYYAGRGGLRPITDLAGALDAIDLLLGQTGGRHGLDPGVGHEPACDAHYRRFRSLLAGRRYRAVDGLAPTGDPLPVDWDAVWRFEGTWSADPEIRAAQEAFAARWQAMARGLEAVFAGEHARFPLLAREMCALGADAVRLMRLPGRRPGWGAGPVL